MTKVEILDMVANHYNSNNRAFKGGGCYYKTTDGRMCAVGMCMNDESIARWGHFLGNVLELSRKIEGDIDEVFKDEFKGHDIDFWTDMQMLHDDAAYWDEEGLSWRGIEKYKALKAKYRGK